MTDQTTKPLSDFASEFAPYPCCEEDVTVDALARGLALRSHVEFRRNLEAPIGDRTPEALREEQLRVGLMASEFGLVFAMRALAAVDADAADEAAKAIWGGWEDGGVMPELLWDWLTEYGIDPEVVSRLAAEQRAEQAGVSRG